MMRRNSVWFAILVGGGVAGLLDLTYAIVFSGFHGVPALRILQSVASGLLGTAAYEGGAATAVLGTALQFLIAFSAAAIFWLVARRVAFLTRHAVVSGFAFGIGVYLVMNLVVLPLSAFPHKVSFAPTLLVANLLAHMFLFGLPVSFAVRHATAGARTPIAPSSA